MSDPWSADDILERDTHSSVTRKRLTRTNRGGIGLFQKIGLLRGWLYDEPYIEYLDDGEVPKFLFATSKPVTEITAEQEHSLNPKKGYSTLVGLTQSRVLIVVAQEPKDETREIPYSDIKHFAIHPESKLKVRTHTDGQPIEPSTNIRFKFDTSLRKISCHSGQSLTITEILDRLGPMLQRNTNQAAWDQKLPWKEAQSEYQNAIQEYEQWQATLKRRVEGAEDASVTTRRLKNVWEHLNDNEQPHFYTTGTSHHHIIRPKGRGPIDSFDHHWSVFSNERIIIKNSSTDYEIRYSEILDFTINERPREQEEATDTVIQLGVKTPDDYHIIDIKSLSQSQLSNLSRFIRKQDGEDL